LRRYQANNFPGLTKTRFAEMIEQATVDAYGDPSGRIQYRRPLRGANARAWVGCNRRYYIAVRRRWRILI